MAQDPRDFIRDAKARGASDETVLLLLGEAGWNEREARSALARHHAAELGLPLPSRSTGSSVTHPLDAFLYVFASGTLIAWVTSALIIAAGLIDVASPPVDAGGGAGASAMVGALATLVVAAPTYLALMAILVRRLHAGVTGPASPPRQWVISATLLVGVATIVGYLVDFVAQILGGDSTTGGLLKSASALGLVGALTVFYLRWLRWSPGGGVAETGGPTGGEAPR